jgi:hypothetical protein
MNFKRLLPVLALVVSVAASCSETATTPFDAPQFDLTQLAVADGQLSLVTYADSVKESWAYAEVDQKGGRVFDDKNGNEIKIMRGAVTEPTWFLMHTLPGDKMIVDLTAWRRINDEWVQVHEFSRESIKLRLSYARSGVKQPNRLKVVYVPSIDDLTTFEPLYTEIYKTEKQAQGKLSHFSIYSMAID